MGNAVFGFTAGALCDFCVIPCLFGLSEIFLSLLIFVSSVLIDAVVRQTLELLMQE